jgi:hypothetical protein
MTNEERELYRKQLILDPEKCESAQNCRLVLMDFFRRFKPKVIKEIGQSEVLIALAPLIGKGVSITYADTKWRVYDLESIKEIKKYSWWKQDNPYGGLGYELDYHDCDDFAEFSKSMFALLWDTNSMGRCMGYVTYNNEVTAHAFDIILALDENGVLKPYLFDTEFDTDPILLTSNVASVNNTSWRIINVRL